MRKEVILAVIIGVLLGGVILYGINLANNSSKQNLSEDITEDSQQTTPTPVKKTDNKLSIITPQNNSVFTDSEITLKGTYKPNSDIAVVSESDDIITSSDSNGNFSADINLITGENTISITAVDEKQATTSASVTVIRAATLPE